jgi:hypothetical protein
MKRGSNHLWTSDKFKIGTSLIFRTKIPNLTLRRKKTKFSWKTSARKKPINLCGHFSHSSVRLKIWLRKRARKAFSPLFSFKMQFLLKKSYHWAVRTLFTWTNMLCMSTSQMMTRNRLWMHQVTFLTRSRWLSRLILFPTSKPFCRLSGLSSKP